MIRRPRAVATAALLVAPAILLAACGGSSSSGTSSTPSPAASSAAPSPTAAAPTATAEPSAGTIDAPFATTDCAVPPPPVAADKKPSGGVTVDGVTVTGKEGQAPVVTIAAKAKPATELVTEDIVVGDGTTAAPGDTVTTEYCGIGLTTRTLFDASWLRGQPATFPLANVIPGWQEGIPGMKVGGRRLLIIPGDLAYGAQGRPGILPDETLVFVVDLTAVG